MSDVRHCGGKRWQRDGDEKLRRQPLPIARPNVQLRRLALTRDSRTRSAPSNFIHFYVGLRMFTSNGQPAGTFTRALNTRGGSLPFALLLVALLLWESLDGTWGRLTPVIPGTLLICRAAERPSSKRPRKPTNLPNFRRFWTPPLRPVPGRTEASGLEVRYVRSHRWSRYK